MRKIISKIKKTLHNNGSSLVLVIVALAFIGILVGALLTSVAYVYRQKLYDYNARSNFYYLDQAMDEIYAGVGSNTVKSLTDAYEKTREEIIKFDVNTKSYKSMDDEDANELFKNYFMSSFVDGTNADYWKVIYDKPGTGGTTNYYSDSACTTSVSEDVYKKSIVFAIRNMITNTSVKLDTSKMKIQYIYVKADGTSVTRNAKDSTLSTSQLAKIVLKNVRLTREAEYKRSNAKGKFKQTISSDIEVSRPDFTVNFGNNLVDISTLFSYCMVADSGVDFDRISGDILTVSGNIYAASDFYNKDYNGYGGYKAGFRDSFTWTQSDGTSVDYKMNKVSAYDYNTSTNANTLYNNGLINSGRATSADGLYYDGYNDRSKYSGLYIDGGRVNILADTLIVPGSIAVMNGGSLSVYGINSTDVKSTNVWADEVVLGGYSFPGLTEDSPKRGANAMFNANMYVKDDSQIESDGSTLKYVGDYYGFSNSESKDQRSFLPIVKKQKASDTANIYEQVVKDEDNKDKIENRGHYNSSSILINGEDATLDLSSTKNVFIAGRSYIELSNAKIKTTPGSVDANKGRNTANNVDTKNKEYEYSTTINDYRTGESISVKSAQLAYYPSKASGSFSSDYKYFNLTDGANGSSLYAMPLIVKYFGTDGTIPITYQEVVLGQGTANEKTKKYYYFDFAQAAVDLYREQMSGTAGAGRTNCFSRFFPDNNQYGLDVPPTINILLANAARYGDVLKKNFIKDYSDYFNFCVNRNTTEKLDFLGYEADYDDAKYRTYLKKDDSYINSNYEVDTNILDDLDTVGRELINKRAEELQNITDYQDFSIQNVELPDYDHAVTEKIYASGVVTRTDKPVDYVNNKNMDVPYTVTKVRADNDDSIESNLNGANETTKNTNKTDSDANTKLFAKDYELHYNYVKYALKDVYTENAASGESEAQFIKKMIDANGEGGITPINYYMNFDELDSLPSGITEINSTNLDLGEYNVWASNGDITIKGKSEITGIVVTKGDVYFENVNKFSGLIICGGKVYISNDNEDLTSINSTSLCRNIINEVISKAANYESDDVNLKNEAKVAVKFLKLFKAYKEIGEKAEAGDLTPSTDKKEITNIDYSDVLRYNNWMRNVD